MKSYSDKLKDPRWQRKRLEIMRRDEFQCQCCGDKKSQLAVHHRYYISKRQPWEYPDWCFKTLCSDCHKEGHERDDNLMFGQNPDQFEDIGQLLGMGNDFTEDFIWDVASEFSQTLAQFSIMDTAMAVIATLRKLRQEGLNE
jgi:hypothetical protein